VSGLGVQGSGLRFKVQGPGCGVSRFRVQVEGSGLRVEGVGAVPEVEEDQVAPEQHIPYLG